jgi:hypothetical protein
MARSCCFGSNKKRKIGKKVEERKEKEKKRV